VTPPAYARQIVTHLSNARMLTAPGQGHAVMVVGCMPRLIKHFIEEPRPQQIDPACLQTLGSTPAFVNYNGAPP
jgi:hypothetical protein